MSLNVRPIMSALLRNRTGAVLVAMQVALALAVMVNALYIVMQRIDKIGRPTGIDVDNVLIVSSSGFTEHYRQVPSIQEDLAYLRGVDGVVAASAMRGTPLSDGGDAEPLVTRPGGQLAPGRDPAGTHQAGCLALRAADHRQPRARRTSLSAREPARQARLRHAEPDRDHHRGGRPHHGFLPQQSAPRLALSDPARAGRLSRPELRGAHPPGRARHGRAPHRSTPGAGQPRPGHRLGALAHLLQGPELSG